MIYSTGFQARARVRRDQVCASGTDWADDHPDYHVYIYRQGAIEELHALFFVINPSRHAMNLLILSR